MPDGDRFCGGCGSRLDDQANDATDSALLVPPAKKGGGLGRFGGVAPGLDVGDGGDDVLLEGTAVNQAVRSETEVHSSAQLRWVVLGVLALGLLVVGLSQWPTGQAPPVRESDTAAEEDKTEKDDDSSTTSTTESTEETGTTDATEDAFEENARDNPIGAPIEGADDETGDDVTVGPVLGTEVGFGIVLGGPGSQTMSLLDLDTGLVHELAARGHPVGAFDGVVVVRTNESVSLLSLEKEDSEGLLLPRSPGGWTEVVAIGGDRVWVIEGDPTENAEGWPVGGYNAAGERTSQLTINPWFANGSLDPLGQLTQTTGGGVYVKDGDGFQRRSTGSLLVAGEEIVLLRECDDEMACRQVWYDRESWEPLDYPEVSVPAQGRSTLQSGDRWLYSLNWMTGEASLYEVKTGRTVPMSEALGNHGEMFHAPISSDGRFFVEAMRSGVRVLDLQHGTEWIYELPNSPVSGGTFGVFVDLADVGFLD